MTTIHATDPAERPASSPTPPVRPTLGRRAMLRGMAGLGLLAGTTAAGCAPGGGGDRIRAYWWGDNALNTAVKAALKIYADEQELRLSTESGPFDGYWDKLATQTAGGNPPDLQMQAASYLPEYSSKQAVAPLDDHFGKEIDISSLDPGLIDFGRMDGKVYGIVGATNAMALLTNSELVSGAGLKPPADQLEWDALADLARKIGTASGGKTFGLQDAGGDLIMFNLWMRERGVDLFDEAGKLGPTEQDLIEWFTWWDQLRADGGVVPAELTSQSAGKIANSAMVSGKAAMTFAWTQDISPHLSNMKADLAVTLPPKTGDQEGNWINAASLWSMSAKTEDKPLVAGLINFLINDERAVTTLQAILGGPPTKAARTKITSELTGADKISVEFMDKVAERSRPLNRLWPPAFAPLRSAFTRANEAIGFKRSSVQQGVTDFLAEVAKNDAG